MNCEYCKKTFATKTVLIHHQKNTRYCLKIQEANTLQLHICKGCNLKLSTNFRLQTHQQICKKYEETNKISDFEKTIEQYKITIEKLEMRVRELELDIKDIALKAKGKTTTNNNGNTYVYQNFTPITDEKLKQDTLNFTKKHLERGGQGIAQYALKGVLKDNFTCTDVSRCHSKYMDADGDIVVDPFSHSIARRVCESLIEPSEKINDDNRSTLSYDTSESVLTKAGMLNKAVNDIKSASTGIMNDLTREFTKTICADSVRKCI